jgi:hypothetical protein
LSPTGALTVALSAIVLLGAIAAWLLNIPPWAIAMFFVGGLVVIRRILRRVKSGRARQEAEAEKKGSGITF